MSAGKPANAGRKQAGRFRKGQSGNPQGKRPGTRHRLTVLAEKITKEDAEEIVAAVVTAAKGGDTPAARLVFERIYPVRKGAPVKFDLPELADGADLAPAIAAVARSMANGDLTPEEASSVAAVLETHRKAIELTQLEDRVAKLEQKSGVGP
jgi:Family of unknown function (DUF5681)